MNHLTNVILFLCCINLIHSIPDESQLEFKLDLPVYVQEKKEEILDLDQKIRVSRQVPAKAFKSFCSGGFEAINSGKNVSLCKKDAYNITRLAHELDCVFPFYYNNRWYDSCTQDGRGLVYWCSLDQVYLNKWATCSESCPQLAKMVVTGTEVHDSCLVVPPERGVRSLFPTDCDIDIILRQHNEVRSNVSYPLVNKTQSFPQAANMMPLSWDIRLARLAQKWIEWVAANQTFQHDCQNCKVIVNDRSMVLGQNLFAANVPRSFFATAEVFWKWPILGAWGGEKSKFVYDSVLTSAYIYSTGHYAQVVNADTSRVGCGAAEISTANGLATYVACNYAVANYFHQVGKPYTNGTSCSMCPGKCVNNLCECKKYCYNDGKLDLKTCTCTCPAWTTGPECETKLCDKTDEQYGCWSFVINDPSYCVYGNVWPRCPHTCGKCARVPIA